MSVGETLASLPPPLLQTSPLLAEPPEPPRFIKEPKDQIGVSGGVASFVCQATGDPKPRVTWNKKGKKVNSQRFEVSWGWGGVPSTQHTPLQWGPQLLSCTPLPSTTEFLSLPLGAVCPRAGPPFPDLGGKCSQLQHT